VAKDFPEVKFESITGYKTAPNVATANARYYDDQILNMNFLVSGVQGKVAK